MHSHHDCLARLDLQIQTPVYRVAHASLSDRSSGRSLSDTDFTELVVVALELPVWSIRPMGELYLISILDREGAVGAHALFGVNVVLP